MWSVSGFATGSASGRSQQMARQWVVRPLAESDIDEAARWYEKRQPGLGLRFLDAVDQVCHRVRAAPMQFPLVHTDLRRALLHTFPYALYFRLIDDSVTVFAVLHLRRDPRVWRAQ